MKIAYTLLLVSLTQCCGSISIEEETPRREETLQVHVASFLLDAKDRGIDLDDSRLRVVEYHELKGMTVGLCTVWNNGLSRIRIDPSWKNESRLKALMYHELGHCLLGLGHEEEYSSNMMAPTVHPINHYEENWMELVDQLFDSYIDSLPKLEKGD